MFIFKAITSHLEIMILIFMNTYQLSGNENVRIKENITAKLSHSWKAQTFYVIILF